MGRHQDDRGGRRADTAPGPGVDHPAAGTASVPAVEPTGTGLLHDPAPTAHVMLALANEVCHAFARAEVARAMAGLSTSDTEHAHLVARAEHWQTLVDERWAALVAAVEAGSPEAAQVERFMPVRPLANGHVELHTHDTKARRLVVLFTGTQALAVGAHLTAYGAISLDRIGHKLDAGLPLVKAAAPPFVTTAPAAARPADHADAPAARP